MVSSAFPASRYRRRILGIGALATGALYVIGAPIVNGRIESDLEQRVPAELDAAGYEGVSASFSGQDGTLSCLAPLDDPEGARAEAFDVWGVRAIDLDRSCRVNTAVSTDATDDTIAEVTGTTGDDAEAADDQVTTTTVAPEPPPNTSESDLATVHDIVAANPDLAFLAVLLADANIGRSDEPVTVFAPNNEAFDEVPADVLGRLQNDAELLTQVLIHHSVRGTIASDELVDGDLDALDGTPLTVVVGDPITVGGADLVDTDIIASNGVVHVIDRVIFPPDIDLEPDVRAASAATFDGESITLTGVVASEVERQVVVQAAVDVAGVNFVLDEMTVDPETGLDSERAEGLAAMIRAMPGNLLSGDAGFNGTELYANGIALSDAGRDAFVAAADAVGVEAAMTDPPVATEDDAVDLEARLNAFVDENPILFEPSSAVLDESAVAVLDRLALDAQQFGGVAITVEGHTDSDGIPIENLQLSQNRAEAVRAALIERGLAAESIEAVGFGSEQPVSVDGVEDKAASRRVEFQVVTSS